MAVLPDARLADEHGVVLGAPAEHLLHALDLDVAADQRIELVLHRRFGQVAAELGKERRLLHARQRGLLVEKRDDVFADGVEAHPFFHQDGRRNRSLFTEDPEQQMLGADVVVQQPIGFLGGKLQHALGLGAERDLDRGRDLFAKDRAPFDFLANALEREVRAGKDPARQPLALANQSEEQVLGFDGNASELTRLVAREKEDASRSFRVTFEHPVTYVDGRTTLLALYGKGSVRPMSFSA